MGLEPIRFNARFVPISTCQNSHNLQGSVFWSSVPPIFHLKYETMVIQEEICPEADLDTMYLGKLQVV